MLGKSEVVERFNRDGIPVDDDWLRRSGPAHFSHITFRGTMKFGVETFAAALIQRTPGQATWMAGTDPCCQAGDGVGRPEPIVRAAVSQAACRKNSTLTASKGNSTSPAGVRLRTPASSSAVTSL